MLYTHMATVGVKWLSLNERCERVLSLPAASQLYLLTKSRRVTVSWILLGGAGWVTVQRFTTCRVSCVLFTVLHSTEFVLVQYWCTNHSTGGSTARRVWPNILEMEWRQTRQRIFSSRDFITTVMSEIISAICFVFCRHFETFWGWWQCGLAVTHWSWST